MRTGEVQKLAAAAAFLTIVFGALGIGLEACGGGGGGGGPVATNPPPAPPGPAPAPPGPGPAPAPPGPAPAPPAPAPPGPGTVTVTVGNGVQSFLLANITVPLGTRVLWDWNDISPHSTTSDEGPGALWDSEILFGTHESFAVTFTAAGSFPYHCKVHGAPGGLGMSGTVTVTP